MATSSFLEIEKLKNNENAKITITGFNNSSESATPLEKLGIVTGYVVENTSFQMGSEFSSPSTTIGEMTGGFVNAYGKIRTAAGGDPHAQRSFTSVIGTMQDWKGSSPFGFTIPTVFVASTTSNNDNPMNPVRSLLQAVLPRFEKVGYTGGLVEQMISPNDYSPVIQPALEERSP